MLDLVNNATLKSTTVFHAANPLSTQTTTGNLRADVTAATVNTGVPVGLD
ncbi:MAG: hypothetical protein ACE5KM_17505 [Planctomycetaceae bacterium]